MLIGSSFAFLVFVELAVLFLEPLNQSVHKIGNLLVPEYFDGLASVLRRGCFLQFRVLNRDSRNPFVELYQDNVLIFRYLMYLIKYGHHALHKRDPEVLRIQRIPKMIGLNLAQKIHLTHLKHLQSRGLKLEIASNRIMLEQLLQFF